MAEKTDQSSYLIKFISTAPVAATIWLTITAGILIEFNRFFPDLLFHPMP
ncbi:photosystem I reaction center subunit IX [Nostoc sp. FACHB-152]|jgi:photosystem I subunit 9|nr:MULTISPECIES: photosystem I reaction center subunit IX [unclassified Nostoc]MBD2446860.1 photosystem I reaction center subunit IX [Nostoc sp. FACHB-152]MBD2467803.1 photosystem I reaction center subunit IX [Nostoc sp. FACHB-145]